MVPVFPSTKLAVGDVVLCKVYGRIYLNQILAIGPKGYLIGNNKGHQNGWTRAIYGEMK